MFNKKLLNYLQCPVCSGQYKFYNIGNTEKIYENSGILTCSKCGRSIIVISGIPIFHKYFDNSSAAFDFLLRIIKGDESTVPFLSSILRRSVNSVKFDKLLRYLHHEKLSRIFELFQTDYINLKRFSSKKYFKIHRFLTDKPIELLLDIGCGFGCSTVPFITSGKAKYCIGLDSSLFFLLLFKKYCKESKLQNVGLILLDAKNTPYPFRSYLFDVVLGVGFFNHFISSKSRQLLYLFFRELTRITKKWGRVYLDCVPNRLYPFPGEVNTPNLLERRSLEKTARILLSFTPFKWLSGSFSVKTLWLLYKVYCRLARIPAESYDIFLDHISGVIPEANVNFLPLLPSHYEEMLSGFAEVTVMPQNKFYNSKFYENFLSKRWRIRDFLKSPYLILYAKNRR